jgi:hypothetical protein
MMGLQPFGDSLAVFVGRRLMAARKDHAVYLGQWPVSAHADHQKAPGLDKTEKVPQPFFVCSLIHRLMEMRLNLEQALLEFPEMQFFALSGIQVAQAPL